MTLGNYTKDTINFPLDFNICRLVVNNCKVEERVRSGVNERTDVTKFDPSDRLGPESFHISRLITTTSTYNHDLDKLSDPVLFL